MIIGMKSSEKISFFINKKLSLIIKIPKYINVLARRGCKYAKLFYFSLRIILGYGGVPSMA